ncbi:hypothetical protein ACFCXF_14245 [Streptomyces virginiae]|uniref:hypothetical protein n=1 Tax=Streptomyces virginiae TaxID=1961 RepID=UPI0035E3097A
MTVTAFDTSERRAWAAQADACAGNFGTLCAYPVPRLLDGGRGRGRYGDRGRGRVRARGEGGGGRADPSTVAVATRNAATADVRPTVLPEPPSPTTRATR